MNLSKAGILLCEEELIELYCTTTRTEVFTDMFSLLLY